MKYLLMFMILFNISIINPVYSADMLNKTTINGFISGSYIHTTGSEFFTKGYYEFGLNINHKFNNKLYFSAGAALRNPTEQTFREGVNNNLFLDYALLGVNLWSNPKREYNLFLGRIKLPYGLYNQSREIPFTRSSAILPQSIYNEKLRDFTLSADGALFQINQYHDYFSLEANIAAGYPRIDEITKFNFFPEYYPFIDLKPELSYLVSAGITSNDLKYQLKYSYANLNVKSTNIDSRLDLITHTISAKHANRKYALTSEFALTDALVKNGLTSSKNVGWYIQGEYFINPQLTLLLRYEDFTANPTNDFLETQNYNARVLNLRYKPKQLKNVTLDLYYTNSIGLAPLIPFNISTFEPLVLKDHWDAYIVSVSYNF